MRILVTAGPTREFLDPVRFISNRSTGKMGYAVARRAITRGHEVVLVSGPVHLAPPEGARLVRIVSARDMLDAVRENLPWCDVLVMSAAVADWRPKQVQEEKLKKAGGIPSLELEPTEDILASVRGVKGQRVYVGFAAETQDLLRGASEKLARKRLDMVVANDVTREDAGFESDTNRVSLLLADGTCEHFPTMAKDDVATEILERVEQLAAGRSAP
jgi:phosphopantothenoylcysteine decarboxylase/phosphopantothenate--cysteine ligase